MIITLAFMKSVIKNIMMIYAQTKNAKVSPIAGSQNPYAVIIVAISCVVITAMSKGAGGLRDQKVPLVLATKTVK